MTISPVVQQIEKKNYEGMSGTAGVVAYSRPGLTITYLSLVTSVISEETDFIVAGPAHYVADQFEAITADAYPAFAAIWDNDADDDYDNL